MIYRFLNYNKSPLVRRLLASVFLLTFPLLTILAVILGTAILIALFLKQFVTDLITTITHDIPSAFKDLLHVARTGNLI